MAEYINKADIIKLINDSMLDLSDSDDLTVMLTEVEELPTITLDHIADVSKKVANGKDTVYRQDVIDQVVTAVRKIILDPAPVDFKMSTDYMYLNIYNVINGLPSAQLGQRYTNEELMIFQHGISLSLLSKRSAQYWRYDENTATEIKFLERLYEKVGADMRGEQDD